MIVLKYMMHSMDNQIMKRLTDDMLHKQKIISLQQVTEVNETDGQLPEPLLFIKYDNGREQYIKGENEINNFINNIIASR